MTDNAKQPDLPRKVQMRKLVILMPRFGVKNIIVKEHAITLPYIRSIDGTPALNGV